MSVEEAKEQLDLLLALPKERPEAWESRHVEALGPYLRTLRRLLDEDEGEILEPSDAGWPTPHRVGDHVTLPDGTTRTIAEVAGGDVEGGDWMVGRPHRQRDG